MDKRITNKQKIKHIIKSILVPMIFSFVPVLSHFIIGLYMMEQENTANLGAIVFLVGIVCFFCWWFTSLYKIAQVNGLKRNQRLKKELK